MSHKAHRAALTSISLALNKTTVNNYAARPRIRGWCIARCACLRPSFRWYSLRLPTEGWPGWVDLGGWFTRPQTVTHPSTNQVRRPTTLLTKPNRHLMIASFNANAWKLKYQRGVSFWTTPQIRYNEAAPCHKRPDETAVHDEFITKLRPDVVPFWRWNTRTLLYIVYYWASLI